MKPSPHNTLKTLLAALGDATVYDLEQPRHPEMPVHPPHRPGYHYFLHRRHEDTYDPERDGPRSSASGLIVAMEHSGTHIDAVCHQADALVLYGGIPVDRYSETAAGFTAHAIDSSRPLLGRGVLLDVAAQRGENCLPAGYEITVDDLQATARAQEIGVRDGDVVLVRTGFGARWNQPSEYLAAPRNGWPG
jgi:kynurenine formamidase